MQCPRCRCHNADNNKYCIECGLPLPWFIVENTIGLRRAADNSAVIGEARHKNNRAIIAEYENSNNPLDILAVAFSYEREGAEFRKQAISYFEKFLANPAPIPLHSHLFSNGKPAPYFSYWCIYSTLAVLYEKEYDFENALKYLRFLPKESNYNNPADYTRVGDVLVKVDVHQAVEYYESLKKDTIYKTHKRVLDIAYQDVLEKQKCGYKYRPKNI